MPVSVSNSIDTEGRLLVTAVVTASGSPISVVLGDEEILFLELEQEAILTFNETTSRIEQTPDDFPASDFV